MMRRKASFGKAICPFTLLSSVFATPEPGILMIVKLLQWTALEYVHRFSLLLFLPFVAHWKYAVAPLTSTKIKLNSSATLGEIGTHHVTLRHRSTAVKVEGFV